MIKDICHFKVKIVLMILPLRYVKLFYLNKLHIDIIINSRYIVSYK